MALVLVLLPHACVHVEYVHEHAAHAAWAPYDESLARRGGVGVGVGACTALGQMPCGRRLAVQPR